MHGEVRLKMRVSMQCSRRAAARHNDRSYRSSDMHENEKDGVFVYSWNGDKNIKVAELEYYRQAFTKGEASQASSICTNQDSRTSL